MLKDLEFECDKKGGVKGDSKIFVIVITFIYEQWESLRWGR